MYNDSLSFLVFFLVIWLLSPIPLAIACIRLSRVCKRLREELTAHTKAPDGENAAPGEGAGNAQPTMAAAPEAESKIAAEAVPLPTARPAMANTKTRLINPLNTIFVIGVLFIITAGIIFASSAWQDLDTVFRIAVLCSVSAFFFGASALARTRFGLSVTGAAFYSLASIFLPLSLLAAGYFRLLGESLSFSGDAKYLLCAASAVLLGAASVRGALRYRSLAFAWTALSSASATVVFLALQTGRGIETVSLFLAAYCACLVLCVEAGSRFGSRIDAVFGGIRTSVFARPFRLFTVLNVCVSAGVTFSGPGGSYFILASCVIFASLFLTSSFNDSRYRYSGLGVFPFSICLVLALIHAPAIDTVPSMALGSAFVMILGMTGIMREGMKKAAGPPERPPGAFHANPRPGRRGTSKGQALAPTGSCSPAAAASAWARSVRSQVKSRSARPKWP